MADAVEIDPRGILYIILEIKKVRVVNMVYNKTALYFVPLRFSRQE